MSADSLPNERVWDFKSAAYLAATGVGGRDPKIKFLFKVRFVINPDVRATIALLPDGQGIADKLDRNLTYIIKSIDMPKYKFNYEQFNYYNFRTKTLKKIEHEPLNFVFYDDIANSALDFVNTYIQLLSPIHRHAWTTGSDLENLGIQPRFEDQVTPTSAQRSVLGANGNAKHILDEIVIEQIYLDRSPTGAGNPQEAIKTNTFVFKNPRLESFDIDANDYEEGAAPHMINCTFDFDALHIITDDTVELNDSNGLMEANDILSAGSNMPRYSRTTQTTAGAGAGGAMLGSMMTDQARPLQAINNILSRGAGLSAGGAAGLLPNAGSLLTNLANRSPLANVVPPGIARNVQTIRSAISDRSIGGVVTGQIRSKLGGFI